MQNLKFKTIQSRKTFGNSRIVRKISNLYGVYNSAYTLDDLLYNVKKHFMVLKFLPNHIEFRYTNEDRGVVYMLRRKLTPQILRYIVDKLNQ